MENQTIKHETSIFHSDKKELIFFNEIFKICIGNKRLQDEDFSMVGQWKTISLLVIVCTE